jgi:hypothetical protein
MQSAAQDTDYRRHYPDAQYLIIELQGIPVGRLYVDRCKKEIRIIKLHLAQASPVRIRFATGKIGYSLIALF